MAWRFLLDGTDISSVAFQKSATRRLNEPSSAKCRVPSDLVDVSVGTSRLRVYDDSNALWFHGIVWYLEDQGDENTAYTDIVAYDPMVLWKYRPARDSDGDFSYPSFWTTQATGPAIMKYILDSSVAWEGGLLLDTAGNIDSGGVSLAGAPADYPMTIADVWSYIRDCGVCDVVIEPINSGGNIGRFNAYNGDFGSDLSGSVVFQWGKGSNNVRQVRRSQDMSNMVNKLWYYIGPKVTTVSDPDATQHWRGSITGDGYPGGNNTSIPLPNPPGGDVDYSNPLGDLITNSRSDYWTSMDIRIMDDFLDDSTVTMQASLYARLWQAEQKARVGPKTLVHVTPIRGLEPDFTVGDLIGVQAGNRLRGGFSGKQRVYELTVNVSDDGVTEIEEIVVSGDQEY